ncbi:MAG: glycosyltransferase family 4 protein [Candidatus Bathyarchaeota archaeon]|nr:glycosyltransferase family 4 protein [Candidatus Bathyarchaeota archaeon]
MRILIFNWRCWLNPEMGGAEVFTCEVAKRWVKAGHEVTLFTAAFAGCKGEETLDGVRVVRSGGRFSVYNEAKRFFKKSLKNEHFDLVVDEINTRPFFAPKFLENGEHVVALIHQLAREYWYLETGFPMNAVGYRLEDRWLRRYVDVPTVTVSESTRMDLATLGFKHVSVVPEGLNFKPLPTLPQKSSHPVIVYSGRLKKAKRPSHAIAAFEKVKQKVPEAELWIIGDGPIRCELERLAGEGVRFLGRIADDERRRLIAQGWVLVHPGIREGWGLNVIEANALGVPAVAYDVPGLKDSVQHNRTGLLVDSGNVAALADALTALLSDGDLRAELSRNALKYSRGFSWDRTAEELLKFALEAGRK